MSGRVEVGLKSRWGRFGVGLGSMWSGFGVDLGLIWVRFGVDLDPSRGRLGSESGSIWVGLGCVFLFVAPSLQPLPPPPPCAPPKGKICDKEVSKKDRLALTLVKHFKPQLGQKQALQILLQA